MFTMAKASSNERSWSPYLMTGICLTSIGLSLVCLIHLFFLPPHSCPCVQVDVTPSTKPEIPTSKTPEKAAIADNAQPDGNHERYRRNINIGANNLYQLQTQLMMIETRLRLMQDEIKRTQSTVGRRGLTGSAGRPGRNGIDGRQGMDGSMGMPGRDGKDGKDGPTGSPGASGPPGVNGLQGPRGEPGVKGMKGPMGDRGEQGLPGPKGSRGITGRNGENGEPGNAGQSGAKGVKGEVGSTKCYVTENGRRYSKDCYLAAQDPDQNKVAREPAGVIFYRWGRTTCPMGTRSIFSGQAASVHHGKRRIGGSSYKCVPSKPWYFGQRSPGELLRNISRLRPRVAVDGETALQASLYYLQCAACLSKSRSIQIMIPARKECSRGWHREYDGFLAVQVNRGEQKELICIDREARGIFGTPDYVMALHADCNTFSCPPYTDAERLPCVVCTM